MEHRYCRRPWALSPIFQRRFRMSVHHSPVWQSCDAPLDPALSEFASLFSSFDCLAKAPFPKIGDDSTKAHDQYFTGEKGGIHGGYPQRLGRRPSLQLSSAAATEGNAYKQRHRRNVAAMRINTVALSDLSGSWQELSPPDEELAVLSPDPISLTYCLRVKNSIPQLMKALPLLPGEAAEEPSKDDRYCSSAGNDHSRQDDSFSENAFCDNKSLSDNGPTASPINTQEERAGKSPEIQGSCQNVFISK